MTQVDKAREIIKQNGMCVGLSCDSGSEDICPCHSSLNGDHSCSEDDKNNHNIYCVDVCRKFLAECDEDTGYVTPPFDQEVLKESSEALLSINPVNKYNKNITGLDGTKTTVDVYRVLVAFNIVDPELQHSLKKLLNLGVRGKGDYTQDLDEAILSLQKMKERKEQECK